MTRETKVGLLIGVVIIVLIGLVVSDHLSVKPRDPSADPSASSSPLLLDGSFPGASEGSQAVGINGAGNNMATYPTPTPASTPSDSGFAPLPGPAVPSQPVTLPGPTASSDMPVASSGSPFGMPPLAYRTGAAPLPVMPGPTGSTGSAISDQVASSGGAGEEMGAGGIGLFDQPQPVGQPQPMVTTLTPDPVTPLTDSLASKANTTLMHTVKASETLWTIAKTYYRDGSQWTKIAQANKEKLGAKNQLKIGMTLQIPDVAASVTSTPVSVPAQATSTVRTITVAKGDTLEKLAERYLGSKTKAGELLKANSDKLKKPEQLQIGMVLKLPESAKTSEVATETPAVKSQVKPETKPETAKPASGSVYEVKKGDTLYTIAKKTLGNAERWREIRDANKDQLGDKENPSLKIGMKLTIPAKTSSSQPSNQAEPRSTSAISSSSASTTDLFSSPASSASVAGDPVMGRSDQLAPTSAMLLTDEPMPSNAPSAKPSSKSAAKPHVRH